MTLVARELSKLGLARYPEDIRETVLTGGLRDKMSSFKKNSWDVCQENAWLLVNADALYAKRQRPQVQILYSLLDEQNWCLDSL